MYAVRNGHGRYYAGRTKGGVTVWRLKSQDARTYTTAFEADAAARRLAFETGMPCRIEAVRSRRGRTAPELPLEAGR